MRSIVISLIILSTSLSGFAQINNKVKFSASFIDAPLSEVLMEIQEKAGILFSYSSSSLPLREPVTLRLNDVDVYGALEKLGKVLPITYKLVNGMIVLRYIDLRQTIRGTVVDQASKMPAIGASVIVLDVEPILGSTTDEEGKFKITGVPVGRRSLQVQYIGYENKILPNILIGTGKEAVVDAELTESITQMEELVVTDIGISALPVNEMAMVSVRSFTVEETKRFPVGLGDPLRLASSFAGVVSTDDINNEIVIRGNTPRGILWKLDGVEIPSPNHFSNEGASSGGISMFSTQVISRSDFSTGAFAPEYGNATAGVFDIHMRKGNNQQQENTLQLGLLGVDVSSEGPFRKGKRSSYLFNYRYSTLSILDKIGLEIQDENESNVFQDLSLKLNFPTRSLGTFSLFGLGGISSFQEKTPTLVDREDYNMGVVGLSNQINLSATSFLKTTVSYSATNIIDDLILNSDSHLQDIKTFNKSFLRGSVLLNKKFSAKHLLESGFTVSKLSYNFKQTFENPANQPPFNNFSRFDEEGASGSEQAFVSWKFRIAPGLSLVNGFHWLRFDLTRESSFEPRSSLRWQFAPDKVLSVGYGLHSRIESLEYYFGNYIADNGAHLKNNTDLGLTKSRHFILGYEKTFKNSAYFKTEVYYQRLFNVPVFVDSLRNAFSTINLSDGYTSEQLINAGTGNNFGIEFTLEKKFSKGYYYLMNLSLYESNYRARDGVRRDTRFNGNFASNFLFGKEFNLGKNGRNNILGMSAKLSYAGNKRYTPISIQASNQFGTEVRPLTNAWRDRYPDHSRFDIQLSYRRNRKKTTSEWRLDLQNVTGRENVLYDYYDPQAKRIEKETQVGFVPVLSYRLEF
ncbi:MAG: TonB-dependent receptor [Cyclobacteriaceae bacterium]